VSNEDFYSNSSGYKKEKCVYKMKKKIVNSVNEKEKSNSEERSGRAA
jgi:hypothetical protein